MAEHTKPTPVVTLGLAAGVVVGVLLTGVVVATGWPDSGDEGEVLVASARNPSALVALDDGGLRYGERLTGFVREVDEGGELEADEVAEVPREGTDEDQRGLLGLVVDDEGRTFASFTDGGSIVVAELSDGEPRVVFQGPAAAEERNGGRLVEGPDGSLLLGIGDLGEPAASGDPDELNGTVVLLDPDGEADQEPEVLAGGFTDPSAIGVVGGRVWVADDVPEDGTDRLGAIGDDGALASVLELEEEGTPSGIVDLGGDRLGLCGYGDGRFAVFDLGSGSPVLDEEASVDGCLLDAAVLASGEVAVAEADTIRVVEVGEG